MCRRMHKLGCHAHEQQQHIVDRQEQMWQGQEAHLSGLLALWQVQQHACHLRRTLVDGPVQQTGLYAHSISDFSWKYKAVEPGTGSSDITTQQASSGRLCTT